MSGPFWRLVARDIRLALRLGGGGSIALAFFVLTVVLVPLGVGPDPATLARIAPGLVWIAALLAVLLSLDRLFQADHEDGSLDQLLLSPLAPEATVLAKTLAHWVTTGLPVTVAAPVLGVTLAMPAEALPILALALLLGTPALSFIGAVGAAVTVGLRRGGLLLSILVLPLYIPTLILGARAVADAAEGLDPWPVLGLLGALTLFSAALCPVASAWAIRINAR